MDKLEPGDVVVYVYPEMPSCHGTLAIVKSYNAANTRYPVTIGQYIIKAPGFDQYGGGLISPWKREAWEKIGHIEPGAGGATAAPEG